MQQMRPAPKASACAYLKPSNGRGLLHVAGPAVITMAGLALSMYGGMPWFSGQLILSVAYVQWFIVLHECGHETMFRSSRMNSLVGRLAAFFSLIPYKCWKRVHASHHHWTGWQDLDPTTAALVPRRLSSVERACINTSWRLWIPLFSVIYRGNYWNLVRLRKLYGANREWKEMVSSAILLLLAYLLLIYFVGPGRVLQLTGAGLLGSLMIEDPLLLSQHTHIPQRVSSGNKVRPFKAFEQEAFTRSLRLPDWISRFVLFHFDAHELHHMYPFVPGYFLRRIPYVGTNEVHWWLWLKTVKAIRAENFLFQNQNDSGIHV